MPGNMPNGPSDTNSSKPAAKDVITIGNAIVDVVANSDDSELMGLGLDKGMMTLIDADRADELYSKMGPGREISGGSAANTAAGIAALGGSTGYIGKVRNDTLGGIFRHDIKAAGVSFDSKDLTDGPPTARCLIFVTPDAQRTMQTFLGACVELQPEDVAPALIASAKVTYMEGYLWDKESAKAAFVKAAEAAHAAGREVSLTLSDPFCVDRHRESFLDLVENHIDILFANEDEICSLYQVDDFDAALQKVRGHVRVACLTRGPQGSVIATPDEVHVIDAAPVSKLVDTTGAGDLYAAGFLFAYTQGLDLGRAGRIASLTAAEAISHYGARPEADLKALISQELEAA